MQTRFPSSRRRMSALIAAGAMAAAFASSHAIADTTWNWQYSGAGIGASGTFTAQDEADAEGFHLITGITGQRNGVAITGLYPTGQAIPGNEPYALDNIVRLGPQGQLTVHGFGFTTADGGHSNPFFADFLATPGYLEVFTKEGSYSELPIVFSAAPVPEPESLALLMGGLFALGAAARSRKK